MFQREQRIYVILFIIFMVLLPVPYLNLIPLIVFGYMQNKKYKSGSYYQVTKTPFIKLPDNKGAYGEYLIYRYLKKYEEVGAKFLFNTYIPKENGETTEIDVLMICSKGIFVFESKNYSGWIFGNEKQKNWYQTLPAGGGSSRKKAFYNPVMQNQTHIKSLKALIGENFPIYSVIVFSDRCTLKKIQMESRDIPVINRYNVDLIVSSIYNKLPNDFISEIEISELYNKLYIYTQIDDIQKKKHVENIQRNIQNLKK